MSFKDIRIHTATFDKKSSRIRDNYKLYFKDMLEGSHSDKKWFLMMISYFLNPLLECVEEAVEINKLQSLENIGSVYVVQDQIHDLTAILSKETDSDIWPPAQQLMSEISSWYLHGFTDLQTQIKEINQKFDQIEKKQIKTALIKANLNYLYHGVKFEYVLGILSNQKIEGHTTQRFWDDGKRHKETDSNYEDSYFMKGISMSRDLEFSLSWGGVLMIFDKSKIQHRHPIESYSWNFHMSGQSREIDHKKEREDFVVLSKKKKRFKKEDNPAWMKEYEEIMSHDLSTMDEDEAEYYQKFKDKMTKDKSKIDLDALKQPEGSFDFSSNDALVGLVLRYHIIEIYGVDNEAVQYVMNHPLFMGILD